jgi:hypothetical protein
MALRLERPELAVAALDSVQHNLNRQLRYAEAYESARRRLELARTAGDLHELCDSYAVTAWCAVYLGSFRDAWAVGNEAFELLQSDVPAEAAHALSWAALAAYYLGEWDDVLDALARVKANLGERAETPTSGFSSPWPAAAFVHEARGDRSAADRLLAEIDGVERGRGQLSPQLSAPLVGLLLVRGELAAARTRLDAVYAQEARLDNLPLLRLAEAELVRAEGAPDRAVELLASVRELAASTGAAYLEPLAALLAGRTAEAADGYDALGMSVYAAVTRLGAAEDALGAGRPDEAGDQLALAAPVLERAGHRPAIARAAALRERLGG